jgi:hypothetical protein
MARPPWVEAFHGTANYPVRVMELVGSAQQKSIFIRSKKKPNTKGSAFVSKTND